MASRSIICRTRRLSQITDLRDTDKSRYFAITELNNNNFIIRSPSSFSYLNHSLTVSSRKRSAIFHTRAGYNYAWAELYFQMVLRVSRPLFVASCLQVMQWVLGQWKGRKKASNNNNYYWTLLRQSITTFIQYIENWSDEDKNTTPRENFTENSLRGLVSLGARLLYPTVIQLFCESPSICIFPAIGFCYLFCIYYFILYVNYSYSLCSKLRWKRLA